MSRLAAGSFDVLSFGREFIELLLEIFHEITVFSELHDGVIHLTQIEQTGTEVGGVANDFRFDGKSSSSKERKAEGIQWKSRLNLFSLLLFVLRRRFVRLAGIFSVRIFGDPFEMNEVRIPRAEFFVRL